MKTTNRRNLFIAGDFFDINPNYPYLNGALILCIVFVVRLIWVKEEKSVSGELSVLKEKP